MKVILTKTGQEKEVSFGYAANYLIPHGLAVMATAAAARKLELAKARETDLEYLADKQNLELNKKFSGKKYILSRPCGEKGKLFGTVTKKEIAKLLGIEKRTIELEKPIREIGTEIISLKFGNYRCKVEIKIVKK